MSLLRDQLINDAITAELDAIEPLTDDDRKEITASVSDAVTHMNTAEAIVTAAALANASGRSRAGGRIYTQERTEP